MQIEKENINKCESCTHWDSMMLTTTVEGIPKTMAEGLCKRWCGAFTYGYYGRLNLKELCDEYK